MANEVQCYVCGEHKRSSMVNGWWVIETTLFGFSCEHLNKTAPTAANYFACGAAHASVLFQRYLTDGTLEKEVHEGKQSKPVGLTEENLLGDESNPGNDKGQDGTQS